MQIWRLCPRRRATHAFDGEGARRYGGRWNYRGTRVVYASATLSLAVLELLVHVEPDTLPDDPVAFCIVIPDDIRIEHLETAQLPRDWRAYPASDATQAIGTRWVNDGKTALLSVPSAIVPLERNYLINPSHPEFARLRIPKPEPLQLDPRLFT